MQTYSFLTGLRNAAIAVLTFGVGLLIMAHPEVANQGVVDFVTNHLRAVLGTITVGGAANLVLDYLHQHYQIAKATGQSYAATFRAPRG